MRVLRSPRDGIPHATRPDHTPFDAYGRRTLQVGLVTGESLSDPPLSTRIIHIRFKLVAVCRLIAGGSIESHLQRSGSGCDLTQGAAFVRGKRAPSVLNLQYLSACPGLGVIRAFSAPLVANVDLRKHGRVRPDVNNAGLEGTWQEPSFMNSAVRIGGCRQG